MRYWIMAAGLATAACAVQRANPGLPTTNVSVLFVDPYSAKGSYFCLTLDGQFTCLDFERMLQELDK